MMNIDAEWKLCARNVSLEGYRRRFHCLVGIHQRGAYVSIMNYFIHISLGDISSSIEYKTDAILRGFRRSPLKAMLPSNENDLSELAYDLAFAFESIIRQLKETD